MESLKSMLFPIFYLAVSHILLLIVIFAGGKMLRFSDQNLVSLLYAAPQKTLAMGVPLLSTFFANNPEILATAILPLIFYHAWQLIVAGFIKSSPLARRAVSVSTSK